jgi:hypothetical protein
MRRALLVIILIGAATHSALASWSDPTEGQYDNSGTFGISVLIFAFAAFGFYKMVTRK